MCRLEGVRRQSRLAQWEMEVVDEFAFGAVMTSVVVLEVE